MSSLLPHTLRRGAIGSENQTTAVRFGVCGAIDKSDKLTLTRWQLVVVFAPAISILRLHLWVLIIATTFATNDTKRVRWRAFR